ncbi:hypothetical protein PW52_07595 [Tamlana sedimentorum]|uniref:Peptidase A1 domain-containing protein n=1 Tax=Neotamlana sedimentorum TaxID=1435349 RepID=A0A0D7W950_9FLAO|nr:hypothetical protein [Tamlana sedimentorum]KJD35609.1 hypothetical protein PW52_07595 [Tamlana sedimentorum]
MKCFKIILGFLFTITVACAQNDLCFGEKFPLKLGQATPYAKVSVGNIEGYFLVDFGTTSSTIDTNNFINGKPIVNSSNKYNNFNFLGNWGSVSLYHQNHKNIAGLTNFKQAGIIGTDFLTTNIYMLDYENNAIYKSAAFNFCMNETLISKDFKAASSVGYYSNDYTKLNNDCTANIPTIPVKIGTISATAQIDSGYDDAKYRHSININRAFFNALIDAGIYLVENPSANITLSTCVGYYSEAVKAYKLPKGVKFSITSIDGSPIFLTNDVNIFLKQTPPEAQTCGGIGTWKIPAAQLGASFLMDSKKVVFDPFQSKVWFYTK